MAISVPKEKIIPIVGTVTALIGAVVAGLTMDILREVCAVLALKYATNLVNLGKDIYKTHKAAKQQ